MSFFDLEMEYRKIREEIRRTELDCRYDDISYKKDKDKFLKLQKRVQVVKMKAAKELAARASRFLSFGILCGKHWNLIKNTPTYFAEKQAKINVAYDLKASDANDPYNDDYYTVMIKLSCPFQFLIPQIDINEINSLFNGRAKIGATIGSPHWTMVFFVGEYAGHFCHLDICCADVPLVLRQAP